MGFYLFILVVVGLAVAAVPASVYIERRVRARSRLFAGMESSDEPESGTTPRGALSSWLGRAGYRHPSASGAFVAITAGFALAGALLGVAVSAARLPEQLASFLLEIPGGTTSAMAPLVLSSPYILFLFMALAPTLFVRSARRERVEQIEADLPVLLDLLGALADAGLGFDAALSRILAADGSERPLWKEIARFQRDIVAGKRRVQALRDLASRVVVPGVSLFVSALVLAEQAGAGLSEALRQQALDVRQRRRERVLLRAQSLPVKLVFPLVICFLPGLFVVVLGPAVYEFIKLAESAIQRAG